MTKRSNPGGWRGFINRMKAGTLLGSIALPPRIPANVLDFFRHLAETEADHNRLNVITDPYKYAAALYRGRLGQQGDHADDAKLTPSPLKTFETERGALRAYWTGEKWRQAWLATAPWVGCIGIGAISATLTTKSFASVMDKVAKIDNPDATNVLMPVVQSAGWFGLWGGLSIAAAYATIRLSGKLKADSSLWITNKLKQAFLAEPDIVHRLTHNRSEHDETKDPDPDAMPDNPHDRMGSSPGQMTGAQIDIYGRGLAAFLTSALAAIVLAKNSVPIGWLERTGEQLNTLFPNGYIDFAPGDNGTLVMAGLTLIGYMGIVTPISRALSKKFEHSFKQIQQAHGKVSETLVNIFANGESMAASQGHDAARKSFTEDYLSYDKAARHQNKIQGLYSAFYRAQGFIGHNIVALVPAALTLAGPNGGPSSPTPVETFFLTQWLMTGLLFSYSEYLELVPQQAEKKMHAGRVAGLARSYAAARFKKAFYSMTGIHDFEESDFADGEDKAALKLSNLELMLRGKNEGFLKIDDIAINKGDWVHIKGASGVGKSSLIKAIAGLWPYGRGLVQKHPGAHMLYTTQTPDLSGPYTLAEHLVYGLKRNAVADFSAAERERMQWALREAGLSDYTDMLEEKGINGKAWNKLLSGGQQQRLVLARILYQKPAVILLDEPTAALDPEAKAEFFAKLKQHCGGATVLAITHDERTPVDDDGRSYFSKRMTLEGGTASLRDLPQRFIENPVITGNITPGVPANQGSAPARTPAPEI